MKAIGLTVHQVRLAKGLTQQEVYGGIVSRSFASRFESGSNDIGASKLFAILDNLAISADELRFIQQSYQPSPMEQALAQIHQYYAAANFTALTDWVRDHQHSPRAYEQLVASYASILLIAYDHEAVHLTVATRPAYRHLLTAKTWTVQELKLANLLIPIIATTDGLPALAPLTTKMEKNCQRYQTQWGDPFNVLDNLIEFYGSLLQTYLNFHDYDNARTLKSKLKTIEAEHLNWDGRLSRQLWLGLWECYFGDWDLGQSLIDEVIAVEERHHPRIDNSLFAIRNVRVKQAREYRNNQ